MAEPSVDQTTAPLPQDGSPKQGHGHKRHPWHYHFSDEEKRVIKECKRESLLYRALPLAALFGVATYAAVYKGYLKPNARFGAAPKVILASILGYGIGKFSYRKTCMKKMMKLPNSRLGQCLKERDGSCGLWGGIRPREGMMMFEAGANPRDMYWGAGPLPTDQPSTTEKLESK